jgi:hypothetical protein
MSQLEGVYPIDPQPKRSLEVKAVCWQSAAQEHPVHTVGSIPVPSAQTAQPLPLCRVAKNSPGASAAPEHPVGECTATSDGLAQTWNPTAQRSATLHPAPAGLLPLLPAPRLHLGVNVAMTPGTEKPPEQPAMCGYFASSVKPSRVPSLHPVALVSPVLVEDIALLLAEDTTLLLAEETTLLVTVAPPAPPVPPAIGPWSWVRAPQPLIAAAAINAARHARSDRCTRAF